MGVIYAIYIAVTAVGIAFFNFCLGRVAGVW